MVCDMKVHTGLEAEDELPHQGPAWAGLGARSKFGARGPQQGQVVGGDLDPGVSDEVKKLIEHGFVYMGKDPKYVSFYLYSKSVPMPGCTVSRRHPFSWTSTAL